MKANELMIGDIVDVHRCKCVADGERFQVWDEYGKVVSIKQLPMISLYGVKIVMSILLQLIIQLMKKQLRLQ